MGLRHPALRIKCSRVVAWSCRGKEDRTLSTTFPIPPPGLNGGAVGVDSTSARLALRALPSACSREMHHLKHHYILTHPSRSAISGRNVACSCCLVTGSGKRMTMPCLPTSQLFHAKSLSYE